MSGHGALNYCLSQQCMLISGKCNHFYFFFFLLFSSFFGTIEVLESENSSAGMTSLGFFLSLLPTRDPSLRGEPRRGFFVSEGFLFSPPISQMSGGFLPMPMPMEMPSHLRSLPRATEVCIPTCLRTSPR